MTPPIVLTLSPNSITFNVLTPGQSKTVDLILGGVPLYSVIDEISVWSLPAGVSVVTNMTHWVVNEDTGELEGVGKITLTNNGANAVTNDPVSVSVDFRNGSNYYTRNATLSLSIIVPSITLSTDVDTVNAGAGTPHYLNITVNNPGSGLIYYIEAVTSDDHVFANPYPYPGMTVLYGANESTPEGEYIITVKLKAEGSSAILDTKTLTLTVNLDTFSYSIGVIETLALEQGQTGQISVPIILNNVPTRSLTAGTDDIEGLSIAIGGSNTPDCVVFLTISALTTCIAEDKTVTFTAKRMFGDVEMSSVSAIFTVTVQTKSLTPLETFHKNDRNPIINTNGILRLLPGNVGAFNGVMARGVWIGYIDRKYFNGLYEPEAKYYTHPSQVAKVGGGVHWANVNYYSLGVGNGIPLGESRFYKYCYIYDGNQRALMSTPIRVYNDHATDAQTPTFVMTADHEVFNNRITEIEVYRADTIDGDYQRILNIPLSFDNMNEYAYSGIWGVDNTEGTTYTGTCSDSIVWVQGQGDTDFGDGNPTQSWDDWLWIIFKGDGDGANTDWEHRAASQEETEIWDLPVSGDAIDIDGWERNTLGDLWNEAVNLRFMEMQPWGHVEYNRHDHTTTHHGRKVVNIGEVVGNGDLIGKYITLGNITRQIIGNQDKYVLVGEEFPFNVVSHSFLIHESPALITFIPEINDLPITAITFKDEGLLDLGTHPLAGEVSIDVNGKFAKVMNGRLFQLNVVLDPGGAEEVHKDWLSYSELDQYDVNPVSNVMKFPDREGGEGTGLAELFGKLVVMKRQGLFMLSCPSNAEPSQWRLVESAHNIGNIAPHGSIEVGGRVYVVFYDGIYALSPNNLAETDTTPTDRMKITDAIGDIYASIEDKTAITSGYDQYTNEIIFRWEIEELQQIWAISTHTGGWRQITTDNNIDIMSLDEEANLIALDTTEKEVYSFGIKEPVTASVKTKRFTLSDERKEVLRKIKTKVKGDDDIVIEVYPDGNSPETYTVAGDTERANDPETVTVAPRLRCEDVKVSIATEYNIKEFELNNITIN